MVAEAVRLIRDLKSVENKTKDKKYFTGEINVHDMAGEVRECITVLTERVVKVDKYIESSLIFCDNEEVREKLEKVRRILEGGE